MIAANIDDRLTLDFNPSYVFTNGDDIKKVSSCIKDSVCTQVEKKNLFHEV